MGIRRETGFWIFLIRWRWLLTNLDMLLLVAIGSATIVFDLMPQIGVCCLVGSLMRYFRFGYISRLRFLKIK